MRILQVSSAKHFGGGEKHLADLIGGLSARGHEVLLAAPASSPLLKLRQIAGLPAENIIPLEIAGALDIGAARRLSALIKTRDIEIVHAHMARDYFPVSLAARFGAGAKFILTRHVLFPMKSLHRFALSNVSRVIAVSSAVEKQLLAEKIFAAEKIVRISNGIDVEHWANAGAGASRRELRREFRAAHGIPETAPLIGTVGELKKLKGQEDFILAAEMLLQTFPDARFISVGADNSAGGKYKAHLQAMVNAIGAAGRFTWLDRVEDTAPLLHSLDVFVSASHSESFGLAMLEAMASGCAVAATETEGAKELLPKENLVPVEDTVKLANAISLYLGDENKRNEAGVANQKIARERFDIKRMIDATEKLYLSV